MVSPRRSCNAAVWGTYAESPPSAMSLRITFSETPVLSAALTRRYPYLPF